MTHLNDPKRSPLLAELRITYRRRKPRKKSATPAERIKCAADASKYLRAIWNKDTLEFIEDFVIVCLDTSHKPLGWLRVATGSLNKAIVDPRVIFGVALQSGAAALVVAHNHPSGEVEPSPEDRNVTARLKQAGDVLSIPLLDHIILSKTDAFSFAEAGDL